jgi:predicted nicotinamide N-methyase
MSGDSDKLDDDSTRIVDFGGAVGKLCIEEPFWSDDPLACGSGTGATLWNGSVQLARYLSACVARGDLEPERAVELGAGGCGVPSLAAAHLGFREVVATDGGSEDVEDNLQNLRRNVAANACEGCCAVHTERLRWGDTVSALGPPFGCVMAAEVVYEAPCAVPLLQCLHDLSASSSLVLFYHTERNAAASAAFWQALPQYFRAELLEAPQS